MKKLTRGAMRLIILTLGLGLLPSAWADFTKTNPVTGETETYTWKFVGTDTWNGSQYWQDSTGANPADGGVPAKTSGGDIWDPILFDGDNISIAASMSVEGWNLRLGLYNGANVRLNTFPKWQGDTDMWVTVDGTSKFTVGGFGGGNLADNKIIKCSTSREGGIEWLVNLATGNNTANNTFEYYLAGSGSVSYQAVSAANHKIKMADVTLSGGEKSVRSKTLVSFTSSSRTFTADATIKVLANDVVVGSDLLVSVNTTGSTTLTTSDRVGACELVQTSTGIILYYVEGATKLFEAKVINAKSKDDARTLSRAIVGSNLSKAAIYGCDANFGRFLCAMGYSGAQFDQNDVELFFESDAGRLQVFDHGVPLSFDEEIAKRIMQASEVTVFVDMHEGEAEATAWGCDLTYDYVKINADYRS